jgi:hypothetical protein
MRKHRDCCPLSQFCKRFVSIGVCQSLQHKGTPLVDRNHGYLEYLTSASTVLRDYVDGLSVLERVVAERRRTFRATARFFTSNREVGFEEKIWKSYSRPRHQKQPHLPCCETTHLFTNLLGEPKPAGTGSRPLLRVEVVSTRDGVGAVI